MKRKYWLILSLSAVSMAGLALAQDATTTRIDSFVNVLSTAGIRSAVFLNSDNSLEEHQDLEDMVSQAIAWTTHQDVMRHNDGDQAGNQCPEIECPGGKETRKEVMPLPGEDPASVALLRWLSGYDLALSEQVKKWGEHADILKTPRPTYPNFLGFINGPVQAEEQGLPDEPGLLTRAAQQSLEHLNDAIEQMGSFVTSQIVPRSVKDRCDPTFIDHLRVGITQQLVGAYPTKKGPDAFEQDPISRIKWILHSYLPLEADGHLYTVPTSMQGNDASKHQAGHSMGRFRMLLPAPAQLIAPMNKDGSPDINHWRLAAMDQNQEILTQGAKFTKVDIEAREPSEEDARTFRPVMQVAFDKDYSTPQLLNELYVTLTVGEFDMRAKTKPDPASCSGYSEIVPINMTNPEAAIVVRGIVDTKGLFPAQKKVAMPAAPAANPQQKTAAPKGELAKIEAAAKAEEQRLKTEEQKLKVEMQTLKAEAKEKYQEVIGEGEGLAEHFLEGTEVTLIIHKIQLKLSRSGGLPMNKNGTVNFTRAKRDDVPFDAKGISVIPDGTEASVVLTVSEKVPLYKMLKKLAYNSDRNTLYCGGDVPSSLNGPDPVGHNLQRCNLRFDTKGAAAGELVGKARKFLDDKVMAKVVASIAQSMHPDQGLSAMDQMVDDTRKHLQTTLLSKRSEIETKIIDLLSKANKAATSPQAQSGKSWLDGVFGQAQNAVAAKQE